MEVRSITRNARMSPQKVREVTRQIQGLPAEQALASLSFVPRKSARLVAKTLKSAIANAENNNDLKPEALRVKEATVGPGQTLKRFSPRARGSAGPILKRSCHIRIVLSDE
ncbi:MAG: 50S ribosomal protein L22 [Verrucomicrobiales bacterium]|nr:50S ribosomal protein L22 [Verrucomicrobiales bacterium]